MLKGDAKESLGATGSGLIGGGGFARKNEIGQVPALGNEQARLVALGMFWSIHATTVSYDVIDVFLASRGFGKVIPMAQLGKWYSMHEEVDDHCGQEVSVIEWQERNQNDVVTEFGDFRDVRWSACWEGAR